ncbi:conserved protein of unknown function [Candidatus Hydrogenisulfobacillus filiaventi]|uniref:Uncharacterized protein n=1 Tax=Candidatus Hydrogenisulfobacillus filiaventi TaxID=2707344 RepID=A0A6F8ZGW9_9FIRM|nr:TraC family protein [Bacillota bacterium]CAB1129235.1 conserved protein of unknown function [Candidatus Hydrogenisulfobacillus filiaventi]
MPAWQEVARRRSRQEAALNRLVPLRAVGPDLCLLERDRFTAVVEATPVNFALRPAPEQERLVREYTAFLNGLDFPLQILVRADALRLDEYLGQLKAQEETVEAHLRPPLRDYLDFIRRTGQVQHLLRRRFFLILSWQGFDTRTRPLRRGEELWEEARQELLRRRGVLEQGLKPLGVRIRPLEGVELFEFIYASVGAGRALPRGVRWEWDRDRP